MENAGNYLKENVKVKHLIVVIIILLVLLIILGIYSIFITIKYYLSKKFKYNGLWKLMNPEEFNADNVFLSIEKGSIVFSISIGGEVKTYMGNAKIKKNVIHMKSGDSILEDLIDNSEIVRESGDVISLIREEVNIGTFIRV